MRLSLLESMPAHNRGGGLEKSEQGEAGSLSVNESRCVVLSREDHDATVAWISEERAFGETNVWYKK